MTPISETVNMDRRSSRLQVAWMGADACRLEFIIQDRSRLFGYHASLRQPMIAQPQFNQFLISLVIRQSEGPANFGDSPKLYAFVKDLEFILNDAWTFFFRLLGLADRYTRRIDLSATERNAPQGIHVGAISAPR